MTPDTEPVRLALAGQGLVSALIAVLVGFHVVHLDDQQIGIILGLYTAFVTFLSEWARSKVYAPKTVLRLLTGQDGTAKPVRTIPALPPEEAQAA